MLQYRDLNDLLEPFDGLGLRDELTDVRDAVRRVGELREARLDRKRTPTATAPDLVRQLAEGNLTVADAAKQLSAVRRAAEDAAEVDLLLQRAAEAAQRLAVQKFLSRGDGLLELIREPFSAAAADFKGGRLAAYGTMRRCWQLADDLRAVRAVKPFNAPSVWDFRLSQPDLLPSPALGEEWSEPAAVLEALRRGARAGVFSADDVRRRRVGEPTVRPVTGADRVVTRADAMFA